MKASFPKMSLCLGLALAALASPARADAPAGNWAGPYTYVGGTRVAGGSGNNMLRVGLNYRFP